MLACSYWLGVQGQYADLVLRDYTIISPHIYSWLCIIYIYIYINLFSEIILGIIITGYIYIYIYLYSWLCIIHIYFYYKIYCASTSLLIRMIWNHISTIFWRLSKKKKKEESFCAMILPGSSQGRTWVQSLGTRYLQLTMEK